MANYTGAVRFEDGAVMLFSYAGTTDIARRRLFDLSEEVSHAQFLLLPDRDKIKDEEPVEVMPYYMHGNKETAFESRASRSLKAITGPVSLEEVQIESEDTCYSRAQERAEPMDKPQDDQTVARINACFEVIHRLALLQKEDPMAPAFTPFPLRQDIEDSVVQGWVRAWEVQERGDQVRLVLTPEGREIYQTMCQALADEGRPVTGWTANSKER